MEKRAEAGDFGLVDELLLALQRPDHAPAGHPEWTRLPPDRAAGIQVSCSS